MPPTAEILPEWRRFPAAIPPPTVYWPPKPRPPPRPDWLGLPPTFPPGYSRRAILGQRRSSCLRDISGKQRSIPSYQHSRPGPSGNQKQVVLPTPLAADCGTLKMGVKGLAKAGSGALRAPWRSRAMMKRGDWVARGFDGMGGAQDRLSCPWCHGARRAPLPVRPRPPCRATLRPRRHLRVIGSSTSRSASESRGDDWTQARAASAS